MSFSTMFESSLQNKQVKLKKKKLLLKCKPLNEFFKCMQHKTKEKMISNKNYWDKFYIEHDSKIMSIKYY